MDVDIPTANALSLFSGAGGDTLGLENAHYSVRCFSEMFLPAIATHLKAFPHSLLLKNSEGKTNICHIPDELFLPMRGSINIIFAGFPCQGFSHAGKKKENDPRNELVHQFVRATKLIQPDWIIGENVKGLLSRKGVHPTSKKKMPIIQIIQSLFAEIGYKITWKLIVATDFGVPQERQRVIIIGKRGNSFPHFNFVPTPAAQPTCIRPLLEPTLYGAVEFTPTPEELESPLWIETTETSPCGIPHPNLVRLLNGIRNKSAKEIIMELSINYPGKSPEEIWSIQNPGMTLPSKNKNKIKLASLIPEKNVHSAQGLISFRRRSSSYHGQICNPDEPSKTIICTYGLCPRLFVGLRNKVTKTYYVRPFTLTELAQIQGFPKDYPFVGTEKHIITQIGNAVPPAIVSSVVNRLNSIVFKDSPQFNAAVVLKEEGNDEEEDDLLEEGEGDLI